MCDLTYDLLVDEYASGMVSRAEAREAIDKSLMQIVARPTPLSSPQSQLAWLSEGTAQRGQKDLIAALGRR